jgi:hypothetical protein
MVDTRLQVMVVHGTLRQVMVVHETHHQVMRLEVALVLLGVVTMTICQFGKHRSTKALAPSAWTAKCPTHPRLPCELVREIGRWSGHFRVRLLLLEWWAADLAYQAPDKLQVVLRKLSSVDAMANPASY